ncbi:MAG: hypothetical protein ACKVPX_07585 [Myxococcaceae bacterium]
MRFVLTMVWAVAAVGCTAARVRAEAAPTLQCDASEVEIAQRQQAKDTWVASGCGRMAVCTFPQNASGEVQCAGGAPRTFDPSVYAYEETRLSKVKRKEDDGWVRVSDVRDVAAKRVTTTRR